MKRKLTLTNTLKTNAEINVSKKVCNAFCDKLRGELTGIYGKSDDELRAVLDDAKKHKPEDWTPTTKKEFIVFLEACAEIYSDKKAYVITEKNKHIRPIQIYEFWRLVKYSEEPYRTVLMIARLTGMRKSDIAKLKWADYDKQEKCFKIIPFNRPLYSNSPAMKRYHTVPVPDILADWLDGLPRQGEMICPFDILKSESYFKKLFRDCDVTDDIDRGVANFHSLRAAFREFGDYPLVLTKEIYEKLVATKHGVPYHTF